MNLARPFACSLWPFRVLEHHCTKILRFIMGEGDSLFGNLPLSHMYIAKGTTTPYSTKRHVKNLSFAIVMHCQHQSIDYFF
jgi:hypothetical protein